MTIQTISLLDANGRLASNYSPSVSIDDLIKIYCTMITTRFVDERMIMLQRQGFIPFAMSARGEEACAVASAAALHLDDWMYPQYREAGIMFWRGFSIQKYVHHMLGNHEDPNLGRQISNHFGSKELNVVTVSCPVGTQIIQAAGCAYAMKMQKGKSIAIAYFGEGTTSQGDFHTGLNFAAVQKAPVIFFCRNNGYAISTPCSLQFASDGIAPKGVGYGIKTYRVDGNDVFALFDTVKKARKYCMEGYGPVLIEAMTYRLGPHSTSDDCTLYRCSKEREKMEALCPISRLRSYLYENNFWSEDRDEVFFNQIRKEIDLAVDIAKNAPLPPIKSLFQDVYHEMPQNLREQYALKLKSKEYLCPK